MNAAVLGCALVLLAPAEEQPGSSETTSLGLDKLADCHGVARFDHGNEVEFLLLQLRDDPRLQRELGLDSQQARKVVASVAFEAEPDKEPEERGEAALSQLAGALPAERLARLQQLHCQREGPVALCFARYANAIGLDAEQRSEIGALARRYRELSRPFHQGIFTAKREEDVPPLGERLLGLSRELDERILDELTDAQRLRWANWLGKKYDWGENPRQVAASPGGSKLAYCGTTAFGSFLGMMNRDGGERVRLTGDRGLVRSPCFSPDGERLVVSAYDDGQWDLHLIDVDGANDRPLKLAKHVPNEGARFTADGASLVFGTDEAGIFEYELASGKLRRIAPRGHRPAISSDGRTIVYELERYRPNDPGDASLFMVDRDGAHQRPLRVRGADVQFVGTQTIALLSGPPLQRELWTVDVKGRSLRKMTRDGGEKTDLGLSSGGTRLVWMRRGADRETNASTPWTLYEMERDVARAKSIIELW